MALESTEICWTLNFRGGAEWSNRYDWRRRSNVRDCVCVLVFRSSPAWERETRSPEHCWITVLISLAVYLFLFFLFASFLTACFWRNRVHILIYGTNCLSPLILVRQRYLCEMCKALARICLAISFLSPVCFRLFAGLLLVYFALRYPVCVYFVWFCFILHNCCIIVSMEGWTWWDWSLILRTYLPSVLWHCWLGHYFDP